MWNVMVILIAWAALMMRPSITMTSNSDVVHIHQRGDVTSKISSSSPSVIALLLAVATNIKITWQKNTLG